MMMKKQSTSTSNFYKIDSWIDLANEWEIGKIWPILSVLNSRYKLSRTEEFALPVDLFKGARIKNLSNVHDVLSNLCKSGVLNITPQNFQVNSKTKIYINKIPLNILLIKLGQERIKKYLNGEV
jgi:hypothetical protein